MGGVGLLQTVGGGSSVGGWGFFSGWVGVLRWVGGPPLAQVLNNAAGPGIERDNDPVWERRRQS